MATRHRSAVDHAVRALLVVATLASLVATGATPGGAQSGSTLGGITKRGAIRVGWGVFYPYMYRDPKTNELTGFAVDYVTELGRDMNVKVEWVEDSWATIIAGLQAAKFDTTLPIGITLPRALAVTYSKPVARQPLGLMVLKKEVGKYKTWQDLDKADRKITTTLGANVDLIATRKFRQAQILRVKAGPDSIQQVLTGRADAWANSYEAFALVGKEHPDLAVVPGPAFGATPIAFPVRQGDFVFRDWLNHWIDETKESGTLARLIQKHGLFEWTRE
jgi:ABC-type amino acid transport substrate-binding protein